MGKMFRSEEAAAHIGLPEGVLDSFVNSGLVEPCETVGSVRYYRQEVIDRLIHELHSRIQRASWRDMEERMEDMERRVESLETRLKNAGQPGNTLL